MIKKLLLLRYVFLIAAGFTIVNSIFFLGVGVMECVKAYSLFFKYGISDKHRPGVLVLQGLDLFLISMVFLIFALGIIRLFIHYQPGSNAENELPDWLKLNSFKDLKVLLWESILVTLVVFCLTRIVIGNHASEWQVLILPLVILILTISLYIMKKVNH